MKKVLISILGAILITTTLHAGTMRFGAGKSPVAVNQISSVITSTGQAVTGNCAFQGVIVRTDGTNNVTLNIYKGTDNTGDKLIPTDTVVLGNSYVFMIEYETPLESVGGVYIEITTAGSCAVQVIYDQG